MARQTKGPQPPEPHPDYLKRAPEWQLCRDVWEGPRAIRARKEEYLPRLNFDNDEYTAYVNRAVWVPAFRRTITAITGAMFREPPRITDFPEPLTADLANIDLRGNNLIQFALKAANELFLNGRFAIELDAYQGRIFWRLHKAEALTSWYEDTWDGPPRLRWTNIIEPQTVPDSKSASGLALSLSARHYRQMKENDAPRVRLFQPQQAFDPGNPIYWTGPVQPRHLPADWKVRKSTTPTLPNGDPLPRIPVWIVNATTESAEPDSPPLYSLGELNVAHFRSSADLEHARHFVALPTPWIATEDDPEEDDEIAPSTDPNYEHPRGTVGLPIGSSRVWKLGPDGKTGYLEIRGPGLRSLENGTAEKKDDMATMAGQFLAPPIIHRETAESSRIRSGTHSATLMQGLNHLESAITEALNFHVRWAMTPNERDQPVKFSLNRAFFDARIDANHATALFKMLHGRAISHETFWDALQQGEWVPPDRTYEQEKALLDAATALNPPDLPGLPEPPTGPPANNQTP